MLKKKKKKNLSNSPITSVTRFTGIKPLQKTKYPKPACVCMLSHFSLWPYRLQSVGLSKKWVSSRKTSISALLTMPKPLTVWITTNCGKFWKRKEYQTTWPASWEIFMPVKKKQLELDMEQQTDSKLGQEYIKAIYCHLGYLTYMQSTSWEMLGWSMHKLESRLLG